MKDPSPSILSRQSTPPLQERDSIRWIPIAHEAAAILVSVFAAALLRILLDEWIGTNTPLVPFCVAVAFCAWHSGLRAALIATGVGALISWLVFLGKQAAFPLISLTDGITLLIFLLAGSAIAFLGHSMKRAQQDARRAEQAARDQAELIRVTLLSIRDGVVTTDDQRVVLQINDAARDILGLPSDSSGIGQSLEPLLQAVTPEQTSSLIAAWVDALDKGTTQARTDIHLPSPAGQLQRIDVHVYPVFISNHSVRGTIAVFRDVTAVRLAEEDVRRSERALNDFFENAVVGLQWVDDQGVVVRANHAELQIAGRAKEEYVGQPLAQFHVNPAMIDQLWSTLREGKHVHDYASKIRRKDGSIRDVIINASAHFEESSFAGARCITRDVTELTQSQSALRNLEDAVPEPLIMTDASRKALQVNPAWQQYTGRPLTSVDDDPWGTVCHPEDLPQLNKVRTAAEQAAIPYQVEFRVRRADGSYRWHLARAVPTLDNHQVQAWVGVLSDIHSQKLALEALSRAYRRKDDFLATLAHELRNPLAPLANAIQLFKMADVTGTDRDQLIGILDRQTKLLDQLISDLLEVSRLTRGKISLKVSTFDIRQLISESVESARFLFDERRQSLEWQPPSEPIFVEADRSKLSAVLATLFDNAAKYSSASATTRVTLEATTDFLQIGVIDEGTGLVPEDIEKLFDLFSHTEHPLKRQSGGLGVGLTIAHRYIDLHGGSITATSEGKNRGTKFQIRLPRLTVTPPSAAAQPIMEPTLPNLRVLVVDDTRTAAFVLSKLLEALHQEVFTENDPLRALDRARQIRPDIIFSDIAMPGMDGYTLARLIREDSLLQSTFLIALTGFGAMEDRQQSLDAGFNMHLIKPVSKDTLHTLLAQRVSPPTAQAS